MTQSRSKTRWSFQAQRKGAGRRTETRRDHASRRCGRTHHRRKISSAATALHADRPNHEDQRTHRRHRRRCRNRSQHPGHRCHLAPRKSVPHIGAIHSHTSTFSSGDQHNQNAGQRPDRSRCTNEPNDQCRPRICAAEIDQRRVRIDNRARPGQRFVAPYVLDIRLRLHRPPPTEDGRRNDTAEQTQKRKPRGRSSDRRFPALCHVVQPTMNQRSAVDAPRVITMLSW